jgi:hypothetical protein
VFFGKVENPKNEKLLDLTGRELATFIPLVIIAFWIGLYPKPFFQILSTPVNNLVATVRPDYPGLNKPVLAVQPAPTEPAEAPAVTPQPSTVPEAQQGRSVSSVNQHNGVIPTKDFSPSGGTCCSPADQQASAQKQVLRLRVRPARKTGEPERQGGRSAQDDKSKLVSAAMNKPAAIVATTK